MGLQIQFQLNSETDGKAALLRLLASSHPEIGKDIAEKKEITPENEQLLREALQLSSNLAVDGITRNPEGIRIWLQPEKCGCASAPLKIFPR